MAKTDKIRIKGKIDIIRRISSPTEKYKFFITDCETRSGDNGRWGPALRKHYHFLLSPAKALVLADGGKNFPYGVDLIVEGRPNTVRGTLNHVKVISIDGVDPRAHAERNGSVTVAEKVKDAAKPIVEAQERAEEDAMKAKAPPEPPVQFKTPQEALDRAMYLVRRQYRLKDPKLSPEDIWQLRDALNVLGKAAGLT